jgi:2-phospho-L-lactate guanylyltransferase
MWAIVPCKKFKYAKSRLSSVMTRIERSQLAYTMLVDVLGVLSKVDRVQGIVIASSDPLAQKCAMDSGAFCVTKNCDEGVSNALTTTTTFLKDKGATGVIIVAGDLPLLKASDITCVLNSLDKSPSVSLAPASSDFGTNVLAMNPTGIIPYLYGSRSFYTHQNAAIERGIEPAVIRTQSLGLDIDTPADLTRFASRPSRNHTYRHLEESGIRHRLLKQCNRVETKAELA